MNRFINGIQKEYEPVRYVNSFKGGIWREKKAIKQKKKYERKCGISYNQCSMCIWNVYLCVCVWFILSMQLIYSLWTYKPIPYAKNGTKTMPISKHCNFKKKKLWEYLAGEYFTRTWITHFSKMTLTLYEIVSKKLMKYFIFGVCMLTERYQTKSLFPICCSVGRSLEISN